MDDVAGSQPVRDEDAFDVAAVDRWLRARLADTNQTDPAQADPARNGAAQAGPPQAGSPPAGAAEEKPAEDAPPRGPLPPGLPEVRQFSGGASNLTYLLRYPDRDLILRRPPIGRKAAGAHDMGREYRVQKRLRPVFPQVPRMVAFCDDPAVLGADFYVMERVPGIIPRRDFPPELTLDPQATRRLAFAVVDVLIRLHELDPVASGLADLGKGSGYTERQVRGWSRRYRDARTENVPSFEPVMEWLAERIPADVTTCVIHNDFRFDNLVFDPSRPGPDGLPRISAVLDWEMATLGDPLMDLGGALAYWVQEDDDEFYRTIRRQPTNAPGMPTRAEVVEYYGRRRGLDVSHWLFYEVFGLFRLAVIAQQIYYRYFHGQTTNPKFKDYWRLVTYLEERCRRLIA